MCFMGWNGGWSWHVSFFVVGSVLECCGWDSLEMGQYLEKLMAQM